MNVSSPATASPNTSASSKSALDAAMAATLAAFKQSDPHKPANIALPPRIEPPKQIVYRDKKEAMDALKALLKVIINPFFLPLIS